MSGGITQPVPVPAGYSFVNAIAMNNSGVIVGNAQKNFTNGSITDGYIYSRIDGTKLFVSDPPCASRARAFATYGINDSGQVFGQCQSSSNGMNIGVVFDGNALIDFGKLLYLVGGNIVGDLVGVHYVADAEFLT